MEPCGLEGSIDGAGRCSADRIGGAGIALAGGVEGELAAVVEDDVGVAVAIEVACAAAAHVGILVGAELFADIGEADWVVGWRIVVHAAAEAGAEDAGGPLARADGGAGEEADVLG